MAFVPVWRRLSQKKFGLADRISDSIASWEWRSPGLLHDAREGKEVVIASDSSGDHREARYRAVGFLVAATATSARWMESREHLRNATSGRRMSYKALRDGIKRAALAQFLDSASTLTGTLAIFLISKEIKTLFCAPGDLRLLPELVVAERGWKPKSFHRLLLVGSLGALLATGLTGDEQNILWINDEDEIAANAYKHNHAGHVIAHCIERYRPEHRGTFVFVTTEGKFDNSFREDIVALADFGAGAMVDVFSKMQPIGTSRNEPLWIPVPSNTRPKAKAITRWLAAEGRSLGTIVVTLDSRGDGIGISVFRPIAISGETFVLRG